MNSNKLHAIIVTHVVYLALWNCKAVYLKEVVDSVALLRAWKIPLRVTQVGGLVGTVHVDSNFDSGSAQMHYKIMHSFQIRGRTAEFKMVNQKLKKQKQENIDASLNKK